MEIHKDIQGYLEGHVGLIQISEKYKMSLTQVNMMVLHYIHEIIKDKDK